MKSPWSTIKEATCDTRIRLDVRVAVAEITMKSLYKSDVRGPWFASSSYVGCAFAFFLVLEAVLLVSRPPGNNLVSSETRPSLVGMVLSKGFKCWFRCRGSMVYTQHEGECHHGSHHQTALFGFGFASFDDRNTSGTH